MQDVIRETVEKIILPDCGMAEKAQARLDSLTKPQGSLGKLEDLAKKIISITGKERPKMKNKVIFTFAADHGVTEEGVSAYPMEVTAQMVYNFIRGGAGINVLAGFAGARVVIADLGVASDLTPSAGLIVRKIGYGTKNIAKGPAMTIDEAKKAVAAGIEIFEDEYKKGLDIAGTGDMGIGNTTPSSAIAALYTGKNLSELTGRGTGIDDAGLKNKLRVIEKALEINRPDKKNPLEVLAKIGGFEIGALAGVILAASARKVPTVIDGFISGAAALIAYHIEPKTKEYMIASHCSVEKGHRHILEQIGLVPVLDLNLRLGEGTGAALCMNMIDAALKIYSEMATFQEAAVSEKTGS